MNVSNNINRFIHTYIEQLLNRLLEVVEDKDKNKVINLMQNNNYQDIQMGKIVQDSYPELDFSVYENLELLRTFKEKFLGTTILNRNDYDNLNGTQLSPNTLKFEYAGKYTKSNIDYPYEFEADINKNFNGNIANLTLSEKDLIQYLRNADSHGDIEIIIPNKREDGFKAKNYIKFKDSRNRFSEIRMTSDSLFQLLEKYYKKVYKNINPKELSIKRKTVVDRLENNIKKPEELREFLSDFCLFIMDPQKIDTTVYEHDIFESSKDNIIADEKKRFFMKCNIQTMFSDNEVYEDKQHIESIEFTEQDILELEEYTKKYPSFYKKSIWSQYDIINEFYRRKYLNSSEYEIDKIMDYISSKAYDGETMKRRMGLNIKKIYRLPSEEIQEIFSLLTKAVFLTNKESSFDLNESIYDSIDVSNLSILNINTSNLPYNVNVLNHIRNSFTHYRYENNSGSEIDLNSKIHLYDFREDRKTGIKTETFNAYTDFLTCFNIVLHSNFLRELNFEFTTNQDDALNLNMAEKSLHIAKELVKNSKLFKNISIDYRNNPQISEIAILLNDDNIKYIGDELKNKDFILKMIKEVPSIYSKLDLFYDDEEILDSAIHKDGYSLLDADRKFWTKENFLIALDSTDSDIYPAAIVGNMPEEYMENHQYLKSMIKANPTIIHIILILENNDILRKEVFRDKKIAECVAKKNGKYLEYFDQDIRNIPEIAIDAIKSSNMDAVEFIDKELLDDEIFKEKVQLIEKEIMSKNFAENDNVKEIQRRHRKVYDIIRFLRDEADKASGREEIQSNIEEKLNLDRLNKSHTDFSSLLLEDLREQGKERGLTDINKAKYIILRDRDFINHTENIQIKLEEGDTNAR